MANTFTDYLEQKILDYVFGLTAFSPAATLYVGLSTTTITDAGGNITEPVGNNYSRVSFTNNKTSFSTAAGTPTEVTNAIDFTFPQASGSWGAITDFFISDLAAAGNIYVYGALTVPKTITTGDTARFAASDFDIHLD
jgi:hypothetical protein